MKGTVVEEKALARSADSPILDSNGAGCRRRRRCLVIRPKGVVVLRRPVAYTTDFVIQQLQLERGRLSGLVGGDQSTLASEYALSLSLTCQACGWRSKF